MNKKKTSMVFFVLMLVTTTVFLSGCTNRFDANMNVLDSGLTLSITDINQDALKLYVQGSDNEILVSKDVFIDSITVDGMNNEIWISHTHEYNNENLTINIPDNTKSMVVYYD